MILSSSGEGGQQLKPPEKRPVTIHLSVIYFIVYSPRILLRAIQVLPLCVIDVRYRTASMPYRVTQQNRR